MANPNAKQVNVLGFDRMEIANVRRCYGANKINYNKLNKLYEKAAALKTQIDAVKALISSWDAPVHQLTKDKLGVELSSEEVLLAHTNPEKFFEAHPELKKEEVEENPDVQAEVASIQAEEAGPEL